VCAASVLIHSVVAVVLGEQHIGQRVAVEGYETPGTLRYYGPHATKEGMRCGVELAEPVGLNNGTIKVGASRMLDYHILSKAFVRPLRRVTGTLTLRTSTACWLFLPKSHCWQMMMGERRRSK